MNTPILPAIQSRTKVFLSGPFGSGKTTLAVARVHWLLRQERVRGDDILVLVPQRTLAEPYLTALTGAGAPAGSPVRITTFASLAQQSVGLYWPLIAPTAGFQDPSREPTFLTLETSQHHMAQLVDAAIERDEFGALRIDRSRVISQVLDNLNKAALLRLDIDAAYDRLELAVPVGEQRAARLNALRAAQRISHEFRALCLRATLLDFSLQIVLFNEQVLRNEWSRTHLLRSRRHLIFDNVEEDTPSAHNLVLRWLPQLESALIAADTDGGYRVFLGADPEGVGALAEACTEQHTLTESHIMSPEIATLARHIDVMIRGRRRAGAVAGEAPLAAPAPEVAPPGAPNLTLRHESFRFYPQMVEWTAATLAQLVHDEGIPPAEIVILAPFVSDALRFSLQVALEKHKIAVTTHRPSRALEAEPSARALFTLARLAHPHWGVPPAPADVTTTLVTSLPRLDPVRANLLAAVVYGQRGRGAATRGARLGEFAALAEPLRERITYAAGAEYDRLRGWIDAYIAQGDDLPLDQFFAQLFGEVLSQPNYGFHADRDAARVASQMVESARKFRWAFEDVTATQVAVAPPPATGQAPATATTRLGRAYLDLAEAGALGALYVPGWRPAEDAVLLAPAYTFLLRNRAATVQFWLDIGASGWWERLYQPLTHPYVLSNRWQTGAPWTDADEYNTRQETLRRLLLGLIRRTRRDLYLGISDFSESGYEQRGPLLMLVNQVLARG
ncbi:MAG: AAA family ATPase [Caldilineaceae bacterium]|nr:AAA family ATPase [Caldilineaceae bacterium]